MSEVINEERLNDYVDGLLSEQEAADVERLLEASPEARDTVAFLRGLRRQAAELPASIEPGRDLWPRVRERMAPAPLAPVVGGRAAATSTRASLPRLSPFQWATLAAAAMVLVVTSSAITAWLVGTPIADPAATLAGAPSPEVVSLGESPTAGAEYAIEIEQLMWFLYENREKLDEDTVSTIETNLRVIDRAIRSAREALEDDPGNAGVTRMLTSNYRHKLQLLQRANRIIELS